MFKIEIDNDRGIVGLGMGYSINDKALLIVFLYWTLSIERKPKD